MDKERSLRAWLDRQPVPEQEAIQALVDDAGSINKAADRIPVSRSNLKRYITTKDIVIIRRYGGRKSGGAAS
jgi:molybdenum-dependent DNA-binding transcriptional regulator ModE